MTSGSPQTAFSCRTRRPFGPLPLVCTLFEFQELTSFLRGSKVQRVENRLVGECARVRHELHEESRRKRATCRLLRAATSVHEADQVQRLRFVHGLRILKFIRFLLTHFKR